MEPLLTLMRHLGHFSALEMLGEPKSGDSFTDARGTLIVNIWQKPEHIFLLATSLTPRRTRMLVWHDPPPVPTCIDNLALQCLRLVNGEYTKLIITDEQGMQHRLTHECKSGETRYNTVKDGCLERDVDMTLDVLEKLLKLLPYEVLSGVVRPSLVGLG